MQKEAELWSFITGASWLLTQCTLWYVGPPLCVRPVCTLREVSSSLSQSLSLSHSQLVLSRGIHPFLLPPFFPAVPATLYLFLPPPFLPFPPPPPPPPPPPSISTSFPCCSCVPARRRTPSVCVCMYRGDGSRIREPVKQATGPAGLPRRRSLFLG